MASKIESLLLFSYQEFDQQMTNQVKTLFEDIDKTLFENAPGPPSLADECDDWLRVFPHLRLINANDG